MKTKQRGVSADLVENSINNSVATKYKYRIYLFNLFIFLLLFTSFSQADEYGKCILKTKINGCTHYFSAAWNAYINQEGESLLFVTFAPASDENVQYSNNTPQSWSPDLAFTPDAFSNPDYNLVRFALKKREGLIVAETQVLDYAQSINYRNKNSAWWSITRNDHEGKFWTIDFNYRKSDGGFYTVKAATNPRGSDSNLQCKVMYYADEVHFAYNFYYENNVARELVDYTDSNLVVRNNKEFNDLILEYKNSQPVLDSCVIS